MLILVEFISYKTKARSSLIKKEAKTIIVNNSGDNTLIGNNNGNLTIKINKAGLFKPAPIFTTLTKCKILKLNSLPLTISTKSNTL
jgi:hypothetical protein